MWIMQKPRNKGSTEKTFETSLLFPACLCLQCYQCHDLKCFLYSLSAGSIPPGPPPPPAMAIGPPSCTPPGPIFLPFLPCLELLCTNMLSEKAEAEEEESKWGEVDTATWGGGKAFDLFGEVLGVPAGKSENNVFFEMKRKVGFSPVVNSLSFEFKFE